MGIQMDAAATAAGVTECGEKNDQPSTELLKPNERLVYEALVKADAPLKAYDLLEGLHDEGLRAPMTIYRALDSLTAKGCVKKIFSINAFVAIRSPSQSPARAFLICRECLQSKEIQLDEKQFARLFSPLLALADDIRIEAFGACHENCRD